MRLCQSRQRFADPLLPFSFLELLERAEVIAGHQLPEGRGLICRRRLIEADPGHTPGAAKRVDRPMHGDRIEPGAGRPAIPVQVALGVDLEEGVLEHVLGQGRVPEISGEVVGELDGVATEELVEVLRSTGVPIATEQILVVRWDEAGGLFGARLATPRGWGLLLRWGDGVAGRPPCGPGPEPSGSSLWTEGWS